MSNKYVYGYGIIIDIDEIYELFDVNEIADIREICNNYNYSFYYNKTDDKCFIGLTDKRALNGDDIDIEFYVSDDDMNEFEVTFGYEAKFNIFILDEDDNDEDFEDYEDGEENDEEI